MIIIDDIEQGSPEWFALKAGVPGASSFNKIVTTKGEPSKQSTDYAYQLAGERLIGKQEESYSSFAMTQGLEREAEARQLYELMTGETVKQVGFVFKSERKDVGCSPDGLMEKKGCEIKCPMLKTQVKYLLDGTLPTDYFTQVQGSMWVCGFNEWEFFTYYPGMPPLLITVKRDEQFIAKLEKAMIDFIHELNKIYTELLRRV